MTIPKLHVNRNPFVHTNIQVICQPGEMGPNNSFMPMPDLLALFQIHSPSSRLISHTTADQGRNGGGGFVVVATTENSPLPNSSIDRVGAKEMENPNTFANEGRESSP